MISGLVWLFVSLAGYKTFIIAAAHIAYAVTGIILGLHDWNVFVTLILNGFGLGALRAGIGKRA
jgi:hypothetical protein